jgi:hypothetical protein
MRDKVTLSTMPFTGFDNLAAEVASGSRTGARALATRDPVLIRQWAERHHAEPATGEATSSGPATVCVNDGGAGIRFNFPGLGRFRAITWEEWLDHFERHQLTFVYEEEIGDRAFALWQDGGCRHGHDLDDWLEAERQLRATADRPMARYRLTSGELPP